MYTINKPPENSENIPRLENGFLRLAQIHNNHDTLIQQLAKITDDDLRQILNNPTLIDSSNQQLLKTITYKGNQLAIHQSVDFVSKALEAMAVKSNKKKNNRFDSFKNNLRFGAEHATADSRIAAHHFEKIIYECAIAYINEIEVNFNKSNNNQGNPLDKYFPNHTKVSNIVLPQNETTLNWLLEPEDKNKKEDKNKNDQDDDGIINIQEAIKTAAAVENKTIKTINTLLSLIDQTPNDVEQFLHDNAIVFIDGSDAFKAYLNSNKISKDRTAILNVLLEHYNDLYSDCTTKQPPRKDQALAQLAQLTDLGSNPNIPAMTTPPAIGPAIVGESNGIRTEEEEEEEEEEEAAEVKAKKPSFLSKFRKYGKKIGAVAALVLGIAVISSGPDDKRQTTKKTEITKTSTSTKKIAPALQSTSSTINAASSTPTAKNPNQNNNTTTKPEPPVNNGNPLNLASTITYDLSKYNSGNYFVWHAIADQAINDANLPSYTNSETIQKAIRYYYEQELTNPIKFLPAIITANPDTLTDNGHIPYSVANNSNSTIKLDLGNLENDWKAMTSWLSDTKNIQTATQFYATDQVQMKSPTPEGSLQLPELNDEIEDLTEFAEIIEDNDNDDIDNGWFAFSTQPTIPELTIPQTNFSTINLEDILTGPAVDFSNIHLPLGTSKNAQSLAKILDRQPTPNFSTIQFDTPFEYDTNWKLS